MKTLLFSVIILASTAGFSQTEPNKTIFKELNVGEVNKVTINSSNYSPNALGSLKDELLGYREKVISVIYNETNNTLSITYNEFMLKKDLVNLFNKHKISYIKNVRSKNLDNQ